MRRVPTTQLEERIGKRFWTKVDKRGPEDCWEWTASRMRDGYGRFLLDGKVRGAHRVAWELVTGQAPEPDVLVCHRCDNPGCVNPRHLWLGSPADNMADRDRKGRRTAPSGEAHGRAKLTAAQVERIRRGDDSAATLAAEYEVSRATIYHARQGRTWRVKAAERPRDDGAGSRRA